jgi:hypothetical protein
MAWTLGGVRIYVQESQEETGQILPRLQPLSGGTIIQAFGYESTVRNIQGLVVGESNKNSIKAFAQDETPVNFVTWEGLTHTGIVRKFNARRTNIVCQTIDITQDEETPVYDVSLEFYIED